MIFFASGFAMKATIAIVSIASVGAVTVIGYKFVKAKQQQHDKVQENVKGQAQEVDDDEDSIESASSSITNIAPPPAQDPEVLQRQQFIREMAFEAWKAYCTHAWGQDVLMPHRKGAFNFWFGPCSGHTMITAMSTLWVMDYKDEFQRAQRWVEKRFDFTQVKEQWDVKATVDDYLGSFLACYALSGEEVFLDRAKLVGDALAPAYKTETGIPFRTINPKTGIYKNLPITSLTEATSGLLEYPLLSDLTGNSLYRTQATRIRTFLTSKSSENGGLFMKSLNLETGDWNSSNSSGSTSSLFHSQRAFFTSLLKSYIQSGGTEAESLVLYRDALDAVERFGLFGTSRTGLVYARNYETTTSTYQDYNEYTGAYLGSLLSLGARALSKRLKSSKKQSIDEYQEERDRIYRHRKLAKDLTETFHKASTMTMTGLPPWRFYFNSKEEATNSTQEYGGFNLGPELAESYFILWRHTHDPKYRDYAWALAQSIYTHCRTESGYSELEATAWLPTDPAYIQPASFLGATLKYLYLTFTDDTVMPLDSWVFNDAGQPLPVKGHYKVASKGGFLSNTCRIN